MTNKTITLACPFCGSKELKQVTDDGVHFTQCKSCEATGPTGFKRGEDDAVDWNTRAALADPVPPSGDWAIDTTAGRPILVYQGCSVIEAEQAYYVLGLINGTAPPASSAHPVPVDDTGYGMVMPPDGVEPLPSRPYASEEDQSTMTDYEIGLGHGGLEMWDKFQPYVTRLQAEVERQRNHFREQLRDAKNADALQFELTKAREYIKSLRDVAYTKGGITLAANIDTFLSNQSAPADKAPPLIQALHANGDRIAMEATIAQQAQRIADLEAGKGQGEPVAWLVESPADLEPINGVAYTKEQADMYRAGRWNVRPVYAEQPAPVAVVMPDGWQDQLFAEMERRFGLSEQYHQDHLVYDDTQIGVEFAIEWIAACLDEVALLNSEQKP